MKFEDLGLLPELLRAVHEAGYTDPTPIQAQAIPIVLQGLDMMGGAQTGTGKTAGFTLPMLQRLAHHASTSSSPARHPVRALILAPTRELAIQVEDSVKTYSKYVPLRSVCIYGGVDIKPQIAELKEGREIIVATPGRLLDHVQQKSVSFNSVEIVILDEADRMLDMGFIPDIKRILAMLPKARQSLLFSATFSEEIKKLADVMLKNPQLIEVARRNMVSETITHKLHMVSADQKRYLLLHLLKESNLSQVLVFVGTKFGASRLSVWLERQGVNATAIHGDKSQQQRSEALEAFKAGTVRVLVATDVAARGLDIDDLPHVVNYELPHTAEDYIHRIGRTGRAGKSGDATSLVSPDEKMRLADIEKLIKFKINQVDLPGFEPGAPLPREDRGGEPKRGRDRERRPDSPRDSHREAPRETRPDPHRDSHNRDAHREARSDARRERPTAPVHMASPASHLPAADGFDYSKPYQAKHAEGTTETRKQETPPRRPIRPISALLGGFGKK